jgi:hypothetical protein
LILWLIYLFIQGFSNTANNPEAQVVSASLYALLLYIRSSSEESDLPSINTIRKIVDDEDLNTDLKD